MQWSEDTFSLSATDLSNFLSCQHLTSLSAGVAKGEIDEPSYRDPSLQILFERGQQHEAAYVKYLAGQGKSVVNCNGKPIQTTKEMMKFGADVIVQATLDSGRWVGRADILVRVDTPSALGNWSYEVQDTKLSQNTKAGTILQLCLYSELLEKLQGSSPRQFHVVMPGTPYNIESYRYYDFKAYYRQVKSSLETFVDKIPGTYPEPVEHCSICKFWQVCDKQRHHDDYLSLVAGIRSLHIEELKSQGINQLEQFATTSKIEKPKRGNTETFLRRQEQAKIQLEGREKNQLIYNLLNIEPGRGLNRLPEPNDADIYFDIEGDIFYPDGGLEYILGFASKNSKNSLEYQYFWSTNKTEEKEAFEKFMSLVMDQWRKNPKMYVYHFAPYEQNAIKRLARTHATYEREVDELLRAERFIDLHAIVKESLIASVESYSLKELEKFIGFARKVELHEASRARKSVEVALELNAVSSLAKETLQTTVVYNEDDCKATEALHRWLEQLRKDAAKNTSLTRPELKTGEASENVEKYDTRSEALYKSLIKNLDVDQDERTAEEKAKWLLAHQIDYFRREDKSAWWEFFRVHELEYEDLLEERKAITGLEFVEALPLIGREKTPTHRYRYPPQEVSIEEGDKLYEVKGEEIGTVKSIDLERNTLDIKKTAKSLEIHPTSIHVQERIGIEVLANSLLDLASDIDEYGLDHKWPRPAAKDLLMKRNPILTNGATGAKVGIGEEVVDAAIRISGSLDKSYLAIQGPPGTGKTYTGARMIIELCRAGKKIGITAISHKVIRNLIDKVIELTKEQNVKILFTHKVSEKSDNPPDEVTEVTNSAKALEAINDSCVVGGTAWLWADKKAQETLDYLFVDEAGQMSLSHVLAASQAAHNLILLGDPQQLEQPQKGAHPEGSDVAALTYLLDGKATIPEGRGLFLETTYRLPPSICSFTSEVFYDSKLKSLEALENQVISGGTPFDGAGLFYFEVDHLGNQSRSWEEVDAVANIVEQVLNGGKWSDKNGATHPLTKDDLLIVAPYNAQVAALMEKLPGMRIGTVDKFQGQEAPVIIYSMTSSTQNDAPRGMSFLFSPNRLNVATSRARCISILVASPRLFQTDYRTIEQMRWANALCMYRELAGKGTLGGNFLT